MHALVVGGGLAGIAMAERLDEAGISFELQCNRSRTSSTSIATGMYNPVVFRRLNLSWMIEDLLPEMHAFFERIEKRLQIPLKAPITFEKRIPSDDYATLWQKRIAEEVIHPRFMAPITDGYGPVLEAGMVDCPALQAAYLDELDAQGRLIDAAFLHDKLQLEEDGKANYAGKVYDLVIFCEGAEARNNPFFQWLPFNPCQGEWVIIQSKEEVTDKVVNNITNVIPLGEYRYKLSSTYSWQYLDGIPKETAQEELTKNFEALFPDASYEIVDHQAALRPTVADRRPYLGRHPKWTQLAIFNGLGSKGVMLAPYFSKQLVEHLLADEHLIQEVDIARHKKRYLHSLE